MLLSIFVSTYKEVCNELILTQPDTLYNQYRVIPRYSKFKTKFSIIFGYVMQNSLRLLNYKCKLFIVLCNLFDEFC